MNRLFHIIILLLMLAACSHRDRHNDAMFMWTPAGTEFDSITAMLEHAYCFNGDRAEIYG